MKIKSLSDIKTNFKNSIPRVPKEYGKRTAEVTDFKEKALAGDDLYKEQMAIAIEEDRRKKGLEKMAAGAWNKGVKEKGIKRIGPGMTAAVDKQAAGFAPHREVIANLELEDKTTDVLTNVTNRVGAIAVALAAKKKELRG